MIKLQCEDLAGRLAMLRASHRGSTEPVKEAVVMLDSFLEQLRATREEFRNRHAQAGALGSIRKRTAAERLARAVREVAAGSPFIHPKLAEQVVASFVGPLELTDREVEVIKLIARGHINREIAEQLDVSVQTIDVCEARALEKLGLRSRAELVRYVLQQGWLLQP
jgi:DNA-binding NarL/FixJ family response regulator